MGEFDSTNDFAVPSEALAVLPLFKRKSHAFNKDVYLLGINEYDEPLWMEAPSWDCDWYWGFGYVETYTRPNDPTRSKDIRSHSHFNRLLWFVDEKTGKHYAHLNESPSLKKTVLTTAESWELSDLMKSFYCLKEAAEIFKRGGSHLSRSDKVDLTNHLLHSHINQVSIPQITARVLEILTPAQQEAK